MAMSWTRDAVLPKWRCGAGVVYRPCDKRTFRVIDSEGNEYARRFRSADAAMRYAESIYTEARRTPEEPQAMFAGCI